MKKTIVALLALAATAAADSNLELIYIGSDNGTANTAGSWYNVNNSEVTTSVPGNGDTLWIGYGRDKHESLPVTVIVNNKATMFRSTINIATGSVLKSTVDDWAAWSTTFNLHSADALIIGGIFYGNYKNSYNSGGSDARTPMILNVGYNGSMRMDGAIVSSTDRVYFSFNATAIGDLTGSKIVHKSRVLLTLTNADASGYTNILTGMTSSLTFADNTALTKVETIDFDNLTSDDVGKYTLSYKQLDSGNYGVVMDYVTTVPEPTTATLSLLALAGLTARRRRK